MFRVAAAKLDGFVKLHRIDPSLLRADNFEAFVADGQKRPLALIEQATGKAAYTGTVQAEGVDGSGRHSKD